MFRVEAFLSLERDFSHTSQHFSSFLLALGHQGEVESEVPRYVIMVQARRRFFFMWEGVIQRGDGLNECRRGSRGIHPWEMLKIRLSETTFRAF